MEGFLLHTLKAIRQDASRKHKELRESCSAALTKLDSKLMPQKQSKAPADQFFHPLKLACESRQPRIICTALDCIQKLVAYGYLRGNDPPTNELADPTRPNIKLMDVVIETMCSCKDISDEAVQLQLLKALLTAVSSQHSAVHDTSLLNAVRACYHIHLVSKNLVNKTTAKATLSQMLNVVFQHMEHFDASGSAFPNPSEDNTPLPPPSTPPPIAIDQATTEGQANIDERLDPQQEDTDSAVEENQEDKALQDEPESKIITEIGDEEIADISTLNENMYPSVMKVLEFQFPEPVGIIPHVSSETTLSSTVGGHPVSESRRTAKRPSLAQFEFASLWHKDAFLLFRALCKLSMKHEDVVEDNVADRSNTVQDPIALKSKVLALDLLLSVLENSGPSFQSSDMFVYAIKQYLVSSLIKNCVSSNTSVVGLSLRIFVTLQSFFKDELKEEIELFISKIFAKVLESPNSPRDHKILVLEVFMRICRDINTLVEMFLNYDCNWGSIDLFARTVQVLTRIATKPDLEYPTTSTNTSSTTGSNSNQNGAQQAGALSVMALDSMVAILKSLSEYTYLEDQLPVAAEITDSSIVPDAIESDTDHATELTKKMSVKSMRDMSSVDDNASGTHAGNGGTVAISESVPGSVVTNGPNRASAAVDSYQQKRRYQNDMRLAVSKFNFKPKAGIQFMIEKGLVEDTVPAIAAALYEHRELFSKTQIGEYIGEEKPRNLEIMKAYVEQFDFTNMTFLDAMRLFMDAFRLPGEGQKIDRIMEKFSEQYRLHNPGVFDDGDSAYLLAYAIIMLNTDAHNPSIKPEKKMNLKSFLNMTNVCNKDEAFVTDIFNSIVSHAISLKEDDDLRERQTQQQSSAGGGGMFGNADAALEKQKREAYSKERSELVSEAQSFLPGATKNFFGPAGRRALGETGLYFQDLHDVLLSNEHVRPMFEVVWGPMLAVFSVMMRSATDPLQITMSVRGMHLAVRIAARFSLAEELSTLINSLSQFAIVQDDIPVEMKNIECISALLSIGDEEGDYLGSSWNQVLLCASQVARMLAMHSSGGEDHMSMKDPTHSQQNRQLPVRRHTLAGTLSRARRRGSSSTGLSTPPRTSTQTSSGFGFFSVVSQGAGSAVADERIRVSNSSMISSNLDEDMIERMYLNSVKLSTSAIADFVTALCQVSLIELKLSDSRSCNVVSQSDDSNPRIFSLQRLVEVADFNMGIRPRFVWERIWSVLSQHFTLAGLHQVVPVSLYAIDSLRQLSTKFLDKDELSGFSFQVRFLKPFEEIMERSEAVEQRELVMNCIQNMLSSKAHNIKSGWQTILEIIQVGVCDEHHSIVVLSLQVLDAVVNKNLEQLGSISDVAQCCLSCASNKMFEQEALSGLDLLHVCFKVAFGGLNSSKGTNHDTWYPVFVSCATLIGDARLEVRTRAFETLLGVLQDHRTCFTPSFLENLCTNILFIVPCNVLQTGTSFHRRNRDHTVGSQVNNTEEFVTFQPADATVLLDDADWASTTYSKYMSQLIATIAVWYNGRVHSVAGSNESNETMLSNLSEFEVEWIKNMRTLFHDSLFEFIFSKLEDYVLLDVDAVSRSTVWVVHDLLEMCAELFDARTWTQTFDFLQTVIQDSVPVELLSEFTKRWILDASSESRVETQRHSIVTDEETASEYSMDSGSDDRSGALMSNGAEIRESTTAAHAIDPLEVTSVFSGSPTRLNRMGSWEPEDVPQPRPRPNDPLPFQPQKVLNMCVVQLQLIRVLGEAIDRNILSIGEHDVKRCLDILEERASFAHYFNTDLDLRVKLQARGFMKQSDTTSKSPTSKRTSPPNLLRQETLSVTNYLQMLMRIEEERQINNARFSTKFASECQNRLKVSWLNLVRMFLEQDKVLEHQNGAKVVATEGQTTTILQKSEAKQYTNSFTPVFCQILEDFTLSKQSRSPDQLTWLLPSVTSLMVSHSRNVRESGKRLLDTILPQVMNIEFVDMSSSQVFKMD